MVYSVSTDVLRVPSALRDTVGTCMCCADCLRLELALGEQVVDRTLLVRSSGGGYSRRRSCPVYLPSLLFPDADLHTLIHSH